MPRSGSGSAEILNSLQSAAQMFTMHRRRLLDRGRRDSPPPDPQALRAQVDRVPTVARRRSSKTCTHRGHCCCIVALLGPAGDARLPLRPLNGDEARVESVGWSVQDAVRVEYSPEARYSTLLLYCNVPYCTVPYLRYPGTQRALPCGCRLARICRHSLQSEKCWMQL